MNWPLPFEDGFCELHNHLPDEGLVPKCCIVWYLNKFHCLQVRECVGVFSSLCIAQQNASSGCEEYNDVVRSKLRNVLDRRSRFEIACVLPMSTRCAALT